MDLLGQPTSQVGNGRLSDIREEYLQSELSEASVHADPIRQFAEWMNHALESCRRDPTAMALATSTPEGMPSVRMVLLKGFDERGFCFYTNYESRKAAELDANPRASLAFYWPELERQVRISGRVERTSREESEAYFRTRPRGSQLGAWASKQSSVLPGREVLEQRLREMEIRFPDEVPLPPFWGGYRVVPEAIEFWQGRANRLHDRILYSREGSVWRIERLSP